MSSQIMVHISCTITRDGGSVVVRSDAKQERVADFLVDYIRDVHFGSGEDNKPPAPGNNFNIKISLDIGTGQWKDEHDCGNEGLACGIVFEAIRQVRGGLKVLELL